MLILLTGINYVQYKSGTPSVQVRMCSKYKQADHQVFIQRGTIQKYFPVDKPSLLLIYQIKMASSLWSIAGCKNQLHMKYHSRLLVSNIYHLEIIIYIIEFTIVNINSERNSLSRNIDNNQYI